MDLFYSVEGAFLTNLKSSENLLVMLMFSDFLGDILNYLLSFSLIKAWFSDSSDESLLSSSSSISVFSLIYSEPIFFNRLIVIEGLYLNCTAFDSELKVPEIKLFDFMLSCDCSDSSLLSASKTFVIRLPCKLVYSHLALIFS